MEFICPHGILFSSDSARNVELILLPVSDDQFRGGYLAGIIGGEAHIVDSLWEGGAIDF